MSSRPGDPARNTAAESGGSARPAPGADAGRARPDGDAAAAGRLYRTREVVELLGISRRQLQYWAQTGLVEPAERTPGGHHRYRFDDLVALRTAARLIEAGVSVQRIRRCVAALRRTLPRIQRPLSELVLVATGDVVLVFGEETAFEAISGQEWVFEVAELERDVARFDRARTDSTARRVEPARRTRKWRSTA